nr:retrovirus-related Pol polyprotein from transposon TNT 1-94 [Tanacetum cinerariifolium]
MTLDHEMYVASLKRSKSYKAQPYQYESTSKPILKAKAKPFPPCTHYGFNDHRPDDYRNYPECEIYGSYDHSALGHNHVIHSKVGVLAESSQSNESSIRVKCNTCGSTVHSTFDNNKFDHFKIDESAQAAKAKEPTKKWKGTIFSANKKIVLIAPRRNDVYVHDMSSLNLNGACFFAKALECVNSLWHKRLSHLNFKNINKLAKQNKVLGLSSLVHSKDKPYTTCEKGKHHRASFKTKHNFSIRKYFYLLHIDLSGPERIPDISYFHVFRCLVFIHNHKDHLGKFNVKADDGYFLGYSSISKDFRVYNIRRQQIEETCHVTFDVSMEAIRFTNTLVDEIGIDDSSRYPPDESRQCQVDFDILYYVIPHGRPLTELT